MSAPESITSSRSQRISILLYGIGVYITGMITILWLIACNASLIPLGASSWQVDSTTLAIFINLILVCLFGLQHSVMARSGFKTWWTQKIPSAAERSTYVLATAIVLAAMLWFWQPMPGVIWSVENPGFRNLVWGLFGLGWIYMVLATFAINHFDLFGLRQVYFYYNDEPYVDLPFVKKWMYHFNRHPIQTGIFIGIWATPKMTIGHLMLSITFTVYILIGLALEERDLIRNFGEQYGRYREEAGGIIPWKRAGK